MSSFAKRFILTITAIPLLFCLIYFLPHHYHLGFAILTVLATLVGSYEMRQMIFIEGESPIVHAWVAVIFPILQYVELAYCPRIPLTLLAFAIILLYGLSKEVFVGSKTDFAMTIDRISRSALLFFYPGILSTFIIRLLFFKEATLLLLMIFLLVFGNDTFAYIFGMLFGRRSRNILAVSPNKSIVGYVGGLVVTLAISLLWTQLMEPLKAIFTPPQALLMGFIVSISGNLGDLIESVFKRGARVKDSGTIILGRGGILDSIDSLLASVPFFYFYLLYLTQ